MPVRYIQKNVTGSVLGTTQGDTQPGSVAAIGWNSTTNQLEINGDSNRHVFSDQETIQFKEDANSVTTAIFIADKAYTVVSVTEVHSVVSSSGTLVVEKDTGTVAPGSGTSLFASGSLDLTSTINTPVTKALTATAATLNLAPGDRLAVVFGGTLTGLIGSFTIVLKPR